MIATQVFGRTGHLSSRVLFGGAALAQVTQVETDVALELAMSYGVNHVDVAAGYGEAEVRVGNWIRRHGQPFFLATKTGERTALKAREQIHQSLARLQVEQVDLLQLHNLVEPQEWEQALGPDGALEAAVEARTQGLVRFIGITGHGRMVAEMHRRALERFDFDTVLLPFSYVLAQDKIYRDAFERLVTLCHRRGVAVQTIKSIAHCPWGEETQSRATWYRPLEDQPAIDNAVHWVMGHAGLFVNAVGDIHLLPKVLDAANRYETMPADQVMQRQVAALGMQPLFT
jgi:aryl-alcohol dehydrogenase-like predicted oxidoreductase